MGIWVLVPYPLCLCATVTTSACIQTSGLFISGYLGLGAIPTVFMRYRDNISMYTNK